MKAKEGAVSAASATQLEIEKQLAGVNGDLSGVSQDAFQQVLSNMQDNDWDGALLPGFPGTGKTELGNAMGVEAGGLFIKLDMGAMRGGIVGESEKKVRAAMQMLKAMGGSEVFFIGTCNSMGSLRPELKRRFGYGTFFFDLPTFKEQKPIWDIYRKRYSINDELDPAICKNWTGAEIKKVCKLADELSLRLSEAAKYITPVVRSMGADVDALRKSADGKYLSATSSGWYQNVDLSSSIMASAARNIETKN